MNAESHGLSDEQMNAYMRVVAGSENLFITGVAGTGKSTLLKAIAANTGWPLVATTGIAAVNIGGLTLHSYLGIGLGTEDVSGLLTRVRKYSAKRWNSTTPLIIDEISMLDGNLLDKLNLVAKVIRQSNLPFGGMRIIAFGDFLQLAPVSGKFAFESAFWKESAIQTINLETVYRQRDQKFIDILSKIRLGVRIDPSDLAIRNATENILKLRSVNQEVDHINSTELNALEGESHTFQSIDFGDIAKLKELLVPETLVLKIGAKVMLMTNLNVKAGLCNGAIGTVLNIGTMHIQVDFGSGHVNIVRDNFDISAANVNVARRHQFPLRVAYAITIHKSQGLTLREADVDLSKCFAPGQVYVALSRVRDLNGLYLKSFDPTRIIADPKALAFHATIPKN